MNNPKHLFAKDFSTPSKCRGVRYLIVSKSPDLSYEEFTLSSFCDCQEHSVSDCIATEIVDEPVPHNDNVVLGLSNRAWDALRRLQGMVPDNFWGLFMSAENRWQSSFWRGRKSSHDHTSSNGEREKNDSH